MNAHARRQPAQSSPGTIDETGLSQDLILQIAAKTLYFAGELTGVALGIRLGVGFEILEPILEQLRRDRHCEIAGGSVIGSSSYRYRLTDAGRIRAALFLAHNAYVGPLPVPLSQYTLYMQTLAGQSAAHVTRDSIGAAFSHLVLNQRVLDRLGPAIAARHSLFVYGPPGNGKTVIAQAIRNVMAGEVLVPHAIDVDGQIIRVFDPVNHEPLPSALQSATALERHASGDARWVRCRPPLVTAGGELTLDTLELGQAPGSGFYQAPLQVVANGGVLVIDDFGRQHASPRDLLNRWIVPLETRVDYLRLQTGQKIAMPFNVFVVFATNLNPAELVDEAFLRRIQYKVLADSPTTAEFVRIFENHCRHLDLAVVPALAQAVIDEELRPRRVALRGCQPRDLIEHALALATYLGRPRALTRELLAESCGTYFVADDAAELESA